MARPRDPAALQKLKGVDKKNPKRMREEPEPTGPLGEPPSHFTNEEKAVWYELGTLAPPRVLTNADRWLVELACSLMARKRKDGIGGRAGLNNGELAMLAQCLSKMGMTPSDRSKVGVPPEKPKDNPFATFTTPASGAAVKPN
jgi:hypothetical protein